MVPAVLLITLREYNFVGTQLWMSDRKDLVLVELTFHKNLYQRLDYKYGAESRRLPVPLLAWPHQPAPDRQTTTSRWKPAHWSTPHLERETPPPQTQTLQHQPETITLPSYKTTINPYSAVHNIPFFCKWCRSRSDGFWRSHLIRIYTVIQFVNLNENIL